MIDVFVDASLSRRRWGCAGVVIQPVAPLSFPTLEFRYPLKPGINTNFGEMLAIIHGAQVLEQALRLIEYDPIHMMVRVSSDSEACIRALDRPTRLRSEAFVRLTKKARAAWNRLREEGIINGWCWRHVPRTKNPADRVARLGRDYYLELYQWENPPQPETSDPSSSAGSRRKARPQP